MGNLSPEELSKRGVRKLEHYLPELDTKRKNRHDEDILCFAFNEHCVKYFPRQRGILNWTHIANEGRSPQQGAKLEKMGVMPGWFDYIFITPGRVAFLEAKVAKRKYNTNQKKFHYMMEPMQMVRMGKFYTVEEGHYMLKSFEIHPIMECRLFKEPVYNNSPADRIRANQEFFKP